MTAISLWTWLPPLTHFSSFVLKKLGGGAFKVYHWHWPQTMVCFLMFTLGIQPWTSHGIWRNGQGHSFGEYLLHTSPSMTSWCFLSLFSCSCDEILGQKWPKRRGFSLAHGLVPSAMSGKPGWQELKRPVILHPQPEKNTCAAPLTTPPLSLDCPA